MPFSSSAAPWRPDYSPSRPWSNTQRSLSGLQRRCGRNSSSNRGWRTASCVSASAKQSGWLDLPRTLAHAIDTLKGDFQSGFYGEEGFEAVAERNARDTDGSTLVRSTRKESLSRFSDRSIDLLHIDGAHSIWI